MHDGISGALLMVRHLDADGVAEVVDRLVSSEGLDAVAEQIPRTPLPGDAFVSGVLATGVVELRRAVASCPQLTTDQIRRVLRHGGPDAEVAARLFPNRGKDAAFAGTIEELLDSVGDTRTRESGEMAVPVGRHGDVSFLLMQLPNEQLAWLLPELPGPVRTTMAAGAKGADLARLTELAVATRDAYLLRGLARRSPMDPATAARLAALDDRYVNQALVADSGVEHAVRHRIFCGFPARPGGARLRLDDGLRDVAEHAAPETLIACGDPELALRALTGRPRPRVADRIAAAIAVWERGGSEFLARVPAEAFGVSVGRLVSAAVAADSAQGLYAAREREARKAATAASKQRPVRRTYDPDGDWGRQAAAMRALDDGHTTPERMIHEVAPARHTLRAFQGRVTYSERNPMDAALADPVRTHLDGPDRGAAWAVLVRLLPDFEGTLAELLTVCSAVAA